MSNTELGAIGFPYIDRLECTGLVLNSINFLRLTKKVCELEGILLMDELYTLSISGTTLSLLKNGAEVSSVVLPGGGGGATNLGVANINANTLDVTSDTGTDATLPAATQTEAGVMTAPDKTKLDGLFNPTGLESVTEGGNQGWRLIGRDPGDYGDIGDQAIDFQDNTVGPSTDIGSTGARSITFGRDNQNNNPVGLVVGFENVLNKDPGAVVASTSHVFGFRNTVNNWSFANFVNGGDNTLSTPGTTGGSANPIAWYNMMSGRWNDQYAGYGSNMFGIALLSGTGGCTTVGIANTDITVTPVTQNQGTIDVPSNPVFLVGNGMINTATFPAGTVRSNAFAVLLSGDASFPSLSNAMIDAAGGDSAVTKQWVQANSTGGKFIQTFVVADWTTQSLTITEATHGKGTDPMIQVMSGAAAPFTKVSIDTQVAANGDITLNVAVGSEFDGKIIIL